MPFSNWPRSMITRALRPQPARVLPPVRRADRGGALFVGVTIVAALTIAQPVGAAPPAPVSPPSSAPNSVPTMDSDIAAQNGTSPAGPGFDPNSPPPAFAQPRHDAPLDPVVAQLIVTRLITLHLLASAHDALDPIKAADAVRNFQTGIGIKPTGVLDRKTIALMAL